MSSMNYHSVCICIGALFLWQGNASFSGIPSPGKPLLPKPRHRFIVIAHRGLHNRYPENSLAAFDAGARAGVDYVEMDLRTTKDSVLVLLHDATVDRTTNGSGAVDRLNYRDLSRLRLKDSHPETADTVPTFEQTLAVCRNRVGIYLDFKSASVTQTMKLVRKYGMEDQMIVYINNGAQYAQWRREEPGMPLMLSLPDSVKSTAGLKDFLSQFPLSLLDGDYSSYSGEMRAEAEKEGVAVWPDIQSEDESLHWQSAINTGFHGLQTDHPEALIRWLEERKLR